MTFLRRKVAKVRPAPTRTTALCNLPEGLAEPASASPVSRLRAQRSGPQAERQREGSGWSLRRRRRRNGADFPLERLRRVTFHRGKVTKARPGAAAPRIPQGEAAVRRGEAAGVDSRYRLGRFVRNSGAGHASCSRGNSMAAAAEGVQKMAAPTACVWWTVCGQRSQVSYTAPVILSEAKNPPLPWGYGFFGPCRASE